MYVFSAGVRALFTLILVVVAVSLVAVIGPFMINDLGSVGVTVLPFLVLGYIVAAVYVLTALFKKIPTTQTESKEDPKNA